MAALNVGSSIGLACAAVLLVRSDTGAGGGKSLFPGKRGSRDAAEIFAFGRSDE